jgi:hypothetical protein
VSVGDICGDFVVQRNVEICAAHFDEKNRHSFSAKMRTRLGLLRKLHVSVAHGTKCRHVPVGMAGYQRLHHAVGVAVRCGRSRSFNLRITIVSRVGVGTRPLTD